MTREQQQPFNFDDDDDCHEEEGISVQILQRDDQMVLHFSFSSSLYCFLCIQVEYKMSNDFSTKDNRQTKRSTSLNRNECRPRVSLSVKITENNV